MYTCRISICMYMMGRMEIEQDLCWYSDTTRGELENHIAYQLVTWWQLPQSVFRVQQKTIYPSSRNDPIVKETSLGRNPFPTSMTMGGRVNILKALIWVPVLLKSGWCHTIPSLAKIQAMQHPHPHFTLKIWASLIDKLSLERNAGDFETLTHVPPTTLDIQSYLLRR